MYIKNHGVPQELVDEMFEVSRQYHALPLEAKMEDYVYKSETLRGYDIHYTKTPRGIVRGFPFPESIGVLLKCQNQKRRDHSFIATIATKIPNHQISPPSSVICAWEDVTAFLKTNHISKRY